MSKMTVEQLLTACADADAERELRATLLRKWAARPPDLASLVLYAAGLHPFPSILREYLTENSSVALWLKSRIVSACARMLEAGETVERAREFLRCVPAVFCPGFSMVGATASEKPAPFRWRAASDDGALSEELRETALGQLYLRLDSTKDAGKTYDVEMLFADGTAETQPVTLDEDGFGEHYFGAFSRYAERLSQGFCLSAARREK